MHSEPIITREYHPLTLLPFGLVFFLGLGAVVTWACIDWSAGPELHPAYWPLFAYAAVMVALFVTFVPHENLHRR